MEQPANTNLLPLLVFSCNYHLGDNYGIYPDASYVGHSLTLPLSCTWLDHSKESVSLVFETRDIETWGEWKGHKVCIGTTDPYLSTTAEIGRLVDPINQLGRQEHFELEVPMVIFKQYVKANNNFYLTVSLDRQPHAIGMSDDFLWTRLETKNCGLRIGWS